MEINENSLDFAISYASEDKAIANEITERLVELKFNVFNANKNEPILVGLDGEKLFEVIFKKAKQVIVLISEDYKNKDWTRFEWDIIRERDLVNRFIPIRLDDAKILGLPSNIIYLRFDGSNQDDIVETCIKKLLSFEKEVGIKRLSEYERILKTMEYDSKGSTAKAYQLVIDGRTREFLENTDIPKENYRPTYKIVESEWYNFSQIKRLGMKITVPPHLSKEELIFNLKHCSATEFNAHKPDAIMIHAYVEDTNIDYGSTSFTAGKLEFAPFGKWEKAEEGFAYNIPTSEFKYSINFATEYFEK